MPAHEKTLKRLDHDAFTTIFGGGDPASRTLTGCTYWLLSNPRVLNRLQNELDNAILDVEKWPNMQILEELPYLKAVLKETLRLQAISTSRLPIIHPDKVLQYKEWVIPPGSAVGMSLRHINHDEELFPESHAFKPERWLDASGKIDVSKDGHFVSFHRGNRMCLGNV